MSVSTISTKLNHSIAIGQRNYPFYYPSDITITSAGAVYNNQGAAGIAITDMLLGSTIGNDGIIVGGNSAIFSSVGVDIYNGRNGSITSFISGIYAAASVTNSGFIYGHGNALRLHPGSFSNLSTGTIASAFTAIELLQPTSSENAGLIEAETGQGVGINLYSGGTILNTGSVQAATALILHGGTLFNDGLIQGEAVSGTSGKMVASANGTAIDFTEPGLFVEESEGIVLGRIVGDGGTLQLDGGSLSQISGFSSDVFEPNERATLAASISGLGTISGFSLGDTIDLDGFDASSETYVTGVGLILSNSSTFETLDVVGDFSTSNFAISGDGGTGTIIEEVTCYARGTSIATSQGEIPVESLKIGDFVKTLHAGFQPIKWIGARSYLAPFANHPKVLPIRITASAIEQDVPMRELLVSPGHAICIDDALIHASRLVNGLTITQVERVEEITYFHIELATHEVIFAENCPAETFMGEHFRKQFHNAEDFQSLYPNHAAPEVRCLPHLSSGFQLGAILRRLNIRAGITEPALHGPLRGYIDHMSPDFCYGWACDTTTPNFPVCLDILVGGRLEGRVLANLHRPDVAAAGFGGGNHGFEFAIPAGTSGHITIRRTSDGQMLPAAAGIRTAA